MLKSFKIIIATVVIALLSLTVNVSAEESKEGSINISPVGKNITDGYFLIQGKPGEKQILNVRMQNTSSELSATSTLFAADAITATGGGMGIIDPAGAKYDGVGGWINLKPNEITLKPGEVSSIPIEFQVPQDVTPGDHLGTIVLYKYVASDKPEASIDGQQKNIIVNRAYSQSIAVLVKIPGPITHNLVVKSVEPSWSGTNLFLNVAIKNDGNVYEKSKGTIELYKGGKLIGKNDATMNSIYPGTEGIYTFAPPEELKEAGDYEALVKWEYADKKIENKLNFKIESRDVKQAAIMQEEVKQGRELSMNSIVLTPKQLAMYGGICVGIILLIVGILLIMIRKKRKARVGNTVVPYNE